MGVMYMESSMLGVFSLIVILIIFAAFIVVPFRIAAKALGARRYSNMICFFAFISSGVAGTLATDIISNSFFAFILTLIFTGVFFSVLFDAGFKQGIAISLLSFVITFGFILILGGLGLGVSAIST